MEGKKSLAFPLISGVIIALVIVPDLSKYVSSATSLQRGNDHDRKILFQLSYIFKKRFMDFMYVSLCFHNGLEENNRMIYSKHRIRIPALNLSYHLLSLQKNKSLNNEVVPFIWEDIQFSREENLKDKTKMRSMVGMNVRVATLYNPPMSLLTMNGSRKILSGYIGDIWHDLQDILKFSYTVHSPKEEELVNRPSECCQPNEDRIVCSAANCHTWSDMVGLLTRGEADVVATSLTPTPERLQAVHFSSPILYTSERLFIRLSPRPPTSYNFYLQPFSTNIWLMIGFMFMVIVPVMHMLLSWFSPNLNHQNVPNGFQEGLKYCLHSDNHKCSKILGSLSYWLTESFGMFCQQGLQFVPQSSAVRLSLCVTMFSSGVIYNIYSGSLASVLAVDRQLKPRFSSLEDLLQSASHPGLSVGVLENSSLITVLSGQNLGPYKKLWEMINSTEFGAVATRFEGFHKACVEDFVFFTMRTSYEGYRKSLQPCELHDIPESNLNTYVGISMSKGFEHNELLDDMILQMNEVGMLHRQRLKWWPPYHAEEYTYAAAQKDAVETGTSDPVMKISLGQITFAMHLLLVGISLSLMIFLCEKISAWQGWCNEF